MGEEKSRFEKEITKQLGDIKNANIEYIVKLQNKVREQSKEIEELKRITQTYNSFATKYLPKDTPIVITNPMYFVNGTFKHNFISKEKIKEKIEELIKEGDYKTEDNPNGRVHFTKENVDYKIEVLQELLKEE